MIHLQLAVRRRATPCTAELVIVDEGKPFDTCAMANVPRPKAASLAEASLGGLGLAMMRSFSDELRYRRHEGRNHLTICVRWTDREDVRDDLDSLAIFRGVDRDLCAGVAHRRGHPQFRQGRRARRPPHRRTRG
jgi:hypothetical protein